MVSVACVTGRATRQRTWRVGNQTLNAAFGVGAVGFVLARWLLSVCNIPALCGWLSGVSSLLAVVCVAAYLGSGTPLRPWAVDRRVVWLLLLTCVLSLVGHGLDAAATEPFQWQAGFVDGVDLLAWVWFVGGGLAAALWLWGGLPRATSRPVEVRHLLLSTLVVLVLGLQVWALFRARPTMWPFIDYPLYSAAHKSPSRAVHFRLYGLTAQEPIAFVEITAEGLGASWFVHHTQVIPQLFIEPSDVLEEFQQTLANSDLPPLQLLVPERTTFVLVNSELEEFAERRVVRLDPVLSESAQARPR